MAYVKYKDPWTGSDLLSGKAFNYIETQHDIDKTEADAHNHDDRYYTKAQADAVFFSNETPYYIDFDADMLDGLHYTGLISTVLPLGAIVYWPHSAGSIPTGWHVCDGSLVGSVQTPDLRDKFVLGSSDTHTTGSSGGSLSQTITGSLTIASHTIIAAEMPIHTHPFADSTNSTGLDNAYTWTETAAGGSTTTRSTSTDSAGTAGGHGHTESTITLAPLDVTPPYYALYMIMKVV